MLNKAITATALAAALLCGGATTATGLHKDVSLSIDGQLVPAAGFALTVADVLSAKGITVTDQDVVTPALDAPLTDGQTIAIQFSKQLTLNVDGTPHTLRTTAATLDAARHECDRRDRVLQTSLPRRRLCHGRPTVDGVPRKCSCRWRQSSRSPRPRRPRRGKQVSQRPRLTTHPAADDSVTEARRSCSTGEDHEEDQDRGAVLPTVKKTSSSLWKGSPASSPQAGRAGPTRSPRSTARDPRGGSKSWTSHHRVLTVGTVPASGGINLPAPPQDRIARVRRQRKINTATATTAACSSTWRPGVPTAAVTSPPTLIKPAAPSRSPWPTATTRKPAPHPGVAPDPHSDPLSDGPVTSLPPRWRGRRLARPRRATDSQPPRSGVSACSACVALRTTRAEGEAMIGLVTPAWGLPSPPSGSSAGEPKGPTRTSGRCHRKYPRNRVRAQNRNCSTGMR